MNCGVIARERTNEQPKEEKTHEPTHRNALTKSIIGKFCLNVLSVRLDETHDDDDDDVDGDEKWFGLFIWFYFAVESRKF